METKPFDKITECNTQRTKNDSLNVKSFHKKPSFRRIKVIHKELIGTYTQHGYRWMGAIWIAGYVEVEIEVQNEKFFGVAQFFLLRSPCSPKRTMTK